MWISADDYSSVLLRYLRCSDTVAPGYHKYSERVNKPIATYISFNYNTHHRVIIPPRVSLRMQMTFIKSGLSRGTTADQIVFRHCQLRGNIMSKKFSVEWLSQSFHDQDNSHKPCATEALHLIGEVENKAPSSPTSEYDSLTALSG